MSDTNAGGLFDYLTRYDRVLEVGIGSRTDLAERLAQAGVEVVAVDITRIDAPPSVAVIQADICSLDPAAVGCPDAVYAQRLPPELHRPTAHIASEAAADLLFTTLGGELPIIDVTTITTPSTVLYMRRGRSDTV